MPPLADLATSAEHLAHQGLLWIGFGTVVGLVAKAIMPGRDPGGAIVTLCMGIGGSVVGCGTLAYFTRGESVSPLSLVGFLAATSGAFFLLLFYRLLGGRFFVEGEHPKPMTRATPKPYYAGRRSRRQTYTHMEDD